MSTEPDTEALSTDADERIPCPDDACVGILDERGVCGTCGRASPDARAASAGARTRHADESPAPATDATPARDVSDADDAGTASVTARAADAGEGGERVPCFDDACVGIIGPDGACGTCHRRPPGDADQPVASS